MVIVFGMIDRSDYPERGGTKKNIFDYQRYAHENLYIFLI